MVGCIDTPIAWSVPQPTTLFKQYWFVVVFPTLIEHLMMKSDDEHT